MGDSLTHNGAWIANTDGHQGCLAPALPSWVNELCNHGTFMLLEKRKTLDIVRLLLFEPYARGRRVLDREHSAGT